jgi:hypothetical protein
MWLVASLGDGDRRVHTLGWHERVNMLVMEFKPGYDGALAVIEDGKLLMSLEPEKDSGRRFSPLTPSVLLEVAGKSVCPMLLHSAAGASHSHPPLSVPATTTRNSS